MQQGKILNLDEGKCPTTANALVISMRDGFLVHHCFKIIFFLLVLVVGGAGFIGYHTTLELLNRGYSPIVLHNFNDEKQSSQWEQMKRRIKGLHKKGMMSIYIED